MQKIGIYGGTFNPPHLGHVKAAEFAVEALCLDRLLIMPSRTPPHKKLPADSPSPRQRLQMLQMIFPGDGKIQVSDLELQREGVSYTFDTVKQVKEQYPEAELILLLGTDMFLSFDSWYCWQELLTLASLAVMYRGDQEENRKIIQKKTFLESRGAKIYLAENPVIPISSTQLRRMMTFQCAEEFLPRQIRSFIEKENLYSVHTDCRDLSVEDLEKTVIGLLNPNRVAHVLGCRDAAVALAEKWGADPVDAARAGLLHDVTKALNGPLQLTLCRTYGENLNEFASKNPKTLHALTGSLVAKRIFGENEAVVSAVCSHTTGKANMNLLEKIIYVADYMEPNRDFDGVDKMRELAYSNIDEALKMGLEMTVNLLKEQGREVSPESREALAWLNQK